MKILLIDDADLILDFLRICLEDELPDTTIDAYPSERLGRPGPDFDWAAYDLLLLDQNLGGGETGDRWLQDYGSVDGFPTTILITAVDDPYVVARAIRSGAQGYLNKADLTPQGLVATVTEILALDAKAMATQLPAEPPRDVGKQFLNAPAAAENVGRADFEFGPLIGHGTGTQVFQASRPGDSRPAALKVIDPGHVADSALMEQCINRARTVAALDNPHLVRIYEQGFKRRFGYIAMELLSGGNLSECIARGMHSDTCVTLHSSIAERVVEHPRGGSRARQPQPKVHPFPRR